MGWGMGCSMMAAKSISFFLFFIGLQFYFKMLLASLLRKILQNTFLIGQWIQFLFYCVCTTFSREENHFGIYP